MRYRFWPVSSSVHSFTSPAAALLCGWMALHATSANADWPTFRGADRTGVAPDTGLLKEWPKDGPKLLWKAEGAGRGYSSLAVAGDMIFTLGDAPTVAEDKDEYLLAFSRADGKLLWKTKTGPAWNEGKESWQSSRSTPTVSGDKVFVLTPQGVLVACEAKTGKEVWKKDLKEEFGGKKADSWGYSESVLVDGDRVIVTPGGPKTTMLALNKNTGETIWTTVREEDRGAGHASIVPSEIGGVKVYVQTTGTGPLGVRASDGQLLWSYPIEKTTAVIPTSIVKNDLVFFAAGYKRGGALLRQVPGENQTVKIEEVYPLNPRLANKHGGVILMGDYLYGDSDDAGIPYCAELMTGEIKWQGRGAGKGSVSVVGADGKTYWRFSDGVMVLADAGAEKYNEISSFNIPGGGDRPSWSHPVITDGKLYLREQDAILCYDLKP